MHDAIDSIFTTPTAGDDGGEHVAGTPAAVGPWAPGMAHGGAPAALLTRALERAAAGDGMRVASIHFTFLGPVPVDDIHVHAEQEKPGRRQQVVAARVEAGGRTAMLARAVLLRGGEVPLPPGAGEARPQIAPPADGVRSGPRFVPADSTGFAPTAMEIVGIPPAADDPPGTVTAWFRLRLPVVPGEAPSPAQRAVAAADFGNGITEPVPFADYLFVNCDLYVALQRDPVGEWVGLRARTVVDAVGTGVTTAELHDERGPVGTAVQTLFVDRR